MDQESKDVWQEPLSAVIGWNELYRLDKSQCHQAAVHETEENPHIFYILVVDGHKQNTPVFVTLTPFEANMHQTNSTPLT